MINAELHLTETGVVLYSLSRGKNS